MPAISDAPCACSGRDIYWAELGAYCEQRADNAASAQLSVQLIQQRGVDAPAFFALFDRMSGMTPADAPPPPDDGTGLSFAMRRAAGLEPADSAAYANQPAALRALALSAGGKAEERLSFAEAAASYGAISAASLAAVYGLQSFGPAELADPRAAASSMPRAQGNALLVTAVGTTDLPARRIELALAAFKRAREQGLGSTMMEILAPLLQNAAPEASLSWAAADLVQAYLAISQSERAYAWYALAVSGRERSSAEGGMRDRLINLLRIAAPSEDVSWSRSDARKLVHRAYKRGGDALGRLAFELALLSALGYEVPPDDSEQLPTLQPVPAGAVSEAVARFDSAVAGTARGGGGVQRHDRPRAQGACGLPARDRGEHRARAVGARARCGCARDRLRGAARSAMKPATRAHAPGPDRHIEAFLEMMSAERGATANTLAAYAHDLSDYARFLKGRKIAPLPAAAESDIRAYLDFLAKAKLSAATALRRRSAIRQLHKFLYAEGFAKSDPSTRVDGARRARRLPKILSEAEVVRLIETVQKWEAKDRARIMLILELLYGAGLRVSELVSLRRAGVAGGKDMLRIRGKGGRERIVPLGSKARAALDVYLAETRDDPRTKTSPYLFPSRGRSGHLTRHRVGQLLKALAREAGFDETRLSPHVLRHAFASHLLAHGADLRSVQSMLGHADIATTEIYTHVQAERLSEAVAAYHPLSRNAGRKKGSRGPRGPRAPRAPRVG